MENLKQPAFPYVQGSGEDENVKPGITKFEYALIHCPPVPDWFHVKTKLEEPKAPKAWTEIPDSDPFKEDYAKWMRGDLAVKDIPEEIQWFVDAHIKYKTECRSFDSAQSAERYFAWREYFANKILTR